MRLARLWPRRSWLVAGITLVAAGVGAHRWAEAHVVHYTGATNIPPNCVACHVSARGGTFLDRVLRPHYRTPLHIAVSPDGQRLYVTAEEAGGLLVVDAVGRRLLAEIPVGQRPHSVVLNQEGSMAYVTDHDADRVSVLDLRTGTQTASLPTGQGPAGIALARDGKALFVANAISGDISVLDLADSTERERLTAGNHPYAAVASLDGAHVLVTNRLANLSRAPAAPVAEVTVVDAASGRVTARHMLQNAHLLEGLTFVPPGDLALVVMVRPKNLIPALQVERGWMMTNGLAVIDLGRGRSAQLPLDAMDAFFADPSDVVVTPDGRYAFVSHGGVDAVSVVDLRAVRELLRESSDAQLADVADRLDASRRYVVKRIGVGSNPRGLAVSPDGRFVYVAERLDDRVGVIDVERLEKVATIDLGGPRHQTLVRRGERVFNSAGRTLQHQFSCRSCHPDNELDSLQYDLEPDGVGRNVVDNRTLLGLRNTGPFKWNGKNTSLYMQCGIRFARFLTRSEPFPPDELNALVAFISSLEPPRNRYRAADGALTEAQRRGRAIFERMVTREGEAIPEGNRCGTCHSASEYTDRRKHDVGSRSPTDDEGAFDTPQLRMSP